MCTLCEDEASKRILTFKFCTSFETAQKGCSSLVVLYFFLKNEEFECFLCSVAQCFQTRQWALGLWDLKMYLSVLHMLDYTYQL